MHTRRAFTLVELLVVLAVIGTLVALLLPAVQKVRAAAGRSHCQNNVKQLLIALHAYHDARQKLPNGVNWPAGMFSGPRSNFWPELFPYVEQDNLYRTINFAVAGNLWYGNNAAATRVPVPTLLCPSDQAGPEVKDIGAPQRYAASNYRGLFTGRQLGDLSSASAALVAAFGPNRGAAFKDVTDGTGNTMVLAEALRGAKDEARGFLWSDQPAGGAVLLTDLTPNTLAPDRCYPSGGWCVDRPALNLPSANGNGSTTDTAAARSRHPGGVNVGMGDGSVRFVPDGIRPEVWRALATIRGGEVPEEF